MLPKLQHYVRERERLLPTHTIPNPVAFETSTFKAANDIMPSLARANVCRPYAEKVVNPPRKPANTARRTSGETACSNKGNRKPAMKQPRRFTANVP